MKTWTTALLVAAMAILAVVAIVPRVVRTRTGNTHRSVYNQLRQLDGAKQQWKLEEKPGSNAWPSGVIMMRYLGRPGTTNLSDCLPSLYGEVYIANRADQPAFVYFTKDTFTFKAGDVFTIDDLERQSAGPPTQ